MATVFIQKNKNQTRVSYAVKFKDPLTGKTKYYKTFLKLIDAQRAANDLRALLDDGKLTEANNKRNKINFLTFEEVAASLKEEWLDRFERQELRPSTYEEYCYRINKLCRTFDKRPLCQISKKELLEFQKNVYKDTSAVTSNRSIFIIKQVFKHSLKIKAAIEDVSAQIKYLSEREHERNNYLLPEMIVQLVEASQKIRSKFYLPALIYLGSEHGASKQEALSLVWEDINFEFEGKGLIRFYRTKNRNERTEYLMPRTKEALLKWRDHLSFMREKRRITDIKSNNVFCRLDGEPFKRFDTAWRAACRIAGFKNLHFHDLRHTFCSNLLLSGADLKRVKDMIGHRDLSMTDRYAHLTLKHKSQYQDKLAVHYSQSSSS